MTFSHAYFNAPGDVRLVYDVQGGQRERAFPAAAADTAIDGEWDGETLTLTCTLEDSSTHAITLTEADIEAAKDGEAL